MKKPNPASSLGPLLQQVLKQHPAFSSTSFGEWSEVAGEQVAKNSQPISLKKKVLKVIVHDSVWKHHMELCKNELIDKINKGRPEPVVEKIVIRVGALPEMAPPLNPEHRLLEKIKPKKYRHSKKKAVTQIPLTPDEKALLKNISDPELRAVCTRLLKKALPEAPEE
ncbi:MAG: DciA family protein [Syntrophobacteraceae bacterium]